MTVLGSLTRSSSYDNVAQAIISETVRRGFTRAQGIPVLADAIQESGLNPTAVSPNGKWVGIYQQDTSYPGRADPNANITAFFDRLAAKLLSPGASTDMWLNVFWLQQRPGETSAALAYTNGRKAYLAEIKTRATEAARLYDLYAGGTVPDNRPAFNEFPIWSPSNSGRSGTKIDAFLLHTQEGGGGDSAAEDLANYLANPANQVSYHYTIGQASDGGVTVVDVVDTDMASWSVLSANPRSINLCFAGSKASWTRADWLKQQGKAIDVAAFIAVQDCKKYGIPTTVIAPPYTGRIPGISDHAYVTKVLKDGTHTDVGPGFPWDAFTTAVNKYASGLTPEVPVVVTPTPKPVGPADDQLTLRWKCLGGQTLVEAVAQIRDKVCGTEDRGKTGVV